MLEMWIAVSVQKTERERAAGQVGGEGREGLVGEREAVAEVLMAVGAFLGGEGGGGGVGCE